jgi:Prokaryotic homologs of the JAB domain
MSAASPSVRIFCSRRSDPRVSLSSEAVDQMAVIASDPESETGGILVGRYASAGRVACVELAAPPPGDSEAGLDWFKRGSEGLAELLVEQWNLPERRYYVGEWHFHPLGSAEPSRQDREQMREVATDKRYRCARPILIIASPATLRRRTPRVFVHRTASLDELIPDE